MSKHFYKCTVKASTLAVSLSALKDHLAITSSDQDDYLTTILKTAIAHAERIINQDLCEKTWVLYMDNLPDGILYIRKYPIKSITHIKYYDSDDTQQTFSSEDYRTDLNNYPARIEPKDGWPSESSETLLRAECQFKTGYASTDDIHEDIIHAIKMIAAELYEHPQDHGGVAGVNRIIGKIKVSEQILAFHRMQEY